VADDAPPPPQLLPPDNPPAPAEAEAPETPVSSTTRLVTLDFASRKSYVTLELERDRARPAPERLWAWVYYFSAEGAAVTYCEGRPAEVARPFARGDRATVVVEVDASSCTPPRTPSTAYYARVNLSTASAKAARLPDSRLSFDVTKATPVVSHGARGAGR
jgi:hypothetical protein